MKLSIIITIIIMTRNRSSEPNRHKSFLGSIFHIRKSVRETNSGQKFPLLDLPQSIRVKIWHILGFSHVKTLRLVCSAIKGDIDTVAGISSAIDSTYEDFPFHCSTAIRKVAIHELITPKYVEFLKYPQILVELEIRGEISTENFNYIIKSCPNISKILIIFNKFVIDHKAAFFPIVASTKSLNPLSKLRTIKLVASTKKNPELQYVYENVTKFLRTLPDDAKIYWLQIVMIHKTPHVMFRELLITTLVFLNKHAETLRYANLTFRDCNPSKGQADQPQSPRTSTGSLGKSSGRSNIKIRKTGTKSQVSAKTSRKGTRTVLPGVVITPHVKDIHTEIATTDKESEGEANVEPDIPDEEKTEDEDGEETNERIIEAQNFLSSHQWPHSRNLEYVLFTLPYKKMKLALNILSPAAKLHTLYLEATRGPSHDFWNLYREFVAQADISNLRYVTFNNIGVDHDKHGDSKPLDLGIFRRSKKLKKLSLVSERRQNFQYLSRVKHITSLPSSLQEVSFEKLHLTPCQVVRLLMCYSNMHSVSLSYWSINDCQFSFLMCLLKWIVKMDLTNVQKIYLVDTKLRFKNKRQAVRNLQEAVAVCARYEDMDETKLIIETHMTRNNLTFAPEISFKKTPIHPKPVRKKIKNKKDFKKPIHSNSSSKASFK